MAEKLLVQMATIDEPEVLEGISASIINVSENEKKERHEQFEDLLKDMKNSLA